MAESGQLREDIASELGVQPEGWTAFKLEQRGIDYVPSIDRQATPGRLFWMWSGSVLNPVVFILGSLVILVAGLSLWQAIILIVLGNFVGFLFLGMASLAGPEAGTAQLVVSRAAFGLKWNRLNATSNWALNVGFETTGLAIVVLALLALLAKAGVAPSTGLKVAMILVAVAIQLPLPLFGHATVLKVMPPLAILLGIFFVVMAILVGPKVHPSLLHQHAGVGGISIALALTLSGGGLDWAAYASDYSRYIPRATSKARVFWSSALGAMIPQIFVMILGAIVATTLSSATNEISGLPTIFPGWFVVPYLILIMVSLFAVTTVDLYSSGLCLQATGIKVKRWQAVCIDLTICTALLFFVIFNGRFNTLLSEFLLFALLWVAPWAGIYLTDLVLRRNRYDPPSLFRVGSSLYWHKNGFNVPAVIAQVVGIVCSALWLDAYPAYVGPLASRIGGASGSDFDILFGGGIAALIYGVLAYRQIRREREETPQYAEDWAEGQQSSV